MRQERWPIPLPNRPITGLAIVFIAGTALGLTFPLALPWLLTVTALLLALALLPGLPATPLLICATLAISWGNASFSRTGSAPAIPAVVKLPAGVLLTGIIGDEPVPVATKSGKLLLKFPVIAEQIRSGRSNDCHAVSGVIRVRLSAEPGAPVPAYGERWALPGHLNQAIYKQGLLAGRPGGLFFTGSARKARRLAEHQGNPLVKYCLEKREWASKVLAHGIADRPEQTCILQSILLGYYSQIPRDLYQTFANTGTLHVFAISGSHVIIYLGVVITILAACGVPRTRWIPFMAPLLILYTVMTGLQPSAVRACIMAIVYWLAPLLGRKPDIFTTLATSAIIILAIQPQDLTHIGFILSYTAVLGLVLYCPVFSGWLKSYFTHDPLKLEPDPAWQTTLRALWGHFSDLLAVSTAAWLVTMPLSLLFFGNFSPIGLPANLLVVPLSSLVIITGVLSLTFGSIALVFADLFNHANLALIVMMTQSAKCFAAIPYGYMKAPPIPLWAVLAFYGVLIIIRFALWVYAREKVTAIEGEE